MTRSTVEKATPSLLAAISDLRYIAELMVWANENVEEEWDFDPTADPNSAYVAWIRRCSPEAILAVLDLIEKAPSG